MRGFSNSTDANQLRDKWDERVEYVTKGHL